MDLDRFLNLVAALFGAMGSVYTLKGVAALSPNLIERLSRSYWGFSSAQIEALTAQKADSIVGIVLVVIALMLAIITIAVVPPDVRFLERRATAITLAVVLTGVSYLALVLIGDAVAKHQRLAVGRVIVAQEIGELLETGRLQKSEIESLRTYGRDLLGWKEEDLAAPTELFKRLAAEAGLSVPDGFDFSEVDDLKDPH